MNENNAVPVAFICDENYALPTAVAVTSLKLSKKNTSRYNVYILGTNLSADSKNRILSLNEKGFSVTLLEETLDEKEAQVIQTRERVSHAALLKFKLPILFPDTEKLLYIDSDVLIQKDLSEFYDTTLEDVYAAVVNDVMTVWGEEHRTWLQFKEDVYFNSGMMLLNLKKMREDSLPKKLLDYRLNGINYFMDQDALNVVFEGKIRLVSPEYNLLNCFFEWHSIEEMRDFYNFDFPGCREMVYQNAFILHFGDNRKPWLHYMGYLSTLYKGVYMLSPYADKELVLQDDPVVLLQNRLEEQQRIHEAEKHAYEIEKQTLEDRVAADEELIQKQHSQLDEILNSLTFRTGRFLTFIPRHILDYMRTSPLFRKK